VRNRALDLMASHDVSRVDSIPEEDELDRLFDWAPAAEDSVDARRASRWLRDCLGELRPQERQALVLAYDRGMSHRDLGSASRAAARHGEDLGAPRPGQPALLRRGMHGSGAMKLARDPHLDALCGEYLLGTLRGPARRRFERALREAPLVAARLRHWQALAPRYSSMIETPPPASAWPRLERELGLSRYRTPWHRRLSLWRGWAIAATAAALLAIGLQIAPLKTTSSFAEIAQLSGPGDATRVSAALSADRRTLELRATRPVLAGPSQSYELWLIPAEGGAPVLARRAGQPRCEARACRGRRRRASRAAQSSRCRSSPPAARRPGRLPARSCSPAPSAFESKAGGRAYTDCNRPPIAYPSPND
jgi:anti-sigma-K factor RskA